MPPYLRHWPPILEDVKLEYSSMSTVFSMLPTSLSSRLPPLRSIRKSASMQTLQSNSRTSSHCSSRSLSGIEAIPPSDARSVTELTVEEHLSVVAASPSRAMTSSDATISREIVDMFPEPPSSGVDWMFAQQGHCLVSVAQEERTRLDGHSNPDFERTAFLDGVTYLLKAMPDNLSEQELGRLRTSMPPQLTPSAAHANSGRQNASNGKQSDRSPLHRAVQMAVVNLFILAHLLLPYVVFLLRLAAKTEREYRVSEHVVGAGMGLANAIGSRGVRITGTIYNMGDGRVGQAITDALAWTVEGITGGLSDGVGEGLSLVGTRRA